MRLKKTETLVLRTCDKNLQGYGGFQWPVKGFVEAPDWDPGNFCGCGLHGLLGGLGNPMHLTCRGNTLFLVVKVLKADIIDLKGKVKFPRGHVVFCGTEEGAAAFLAKHGFNQGVPFATETAGDWGISVTGARGSSKAGDRGIAICGRGGTATAGADESIAAGSGGSLVQVGVSGTAVAGGYGRAYSGDYGYSVAGFSGFASTGDYGTALAGTQGAARAGIGGSICLKGYKQNTGSLLVTGFIDGKKLQPNTWYELNANLNFKKLSTKEIEAEGLD